LIIDTNEEKACMAQIISNMIQAQVFRRRQGTEYEFLLLQRAEDEPVYPLMWQAVTGYLLDGESACQCALREIAEETGLRDGILYAIPHIASFYHAGSDAVCLIPVFALEVAADAKVALSGEHRDHVWDSFEDALRRLPIPAHRDALRVLRENILFEAPHAGLFRLD
jgi:dihydroneopterin triphosphate diphosphatase